MIGFNQVNREPGSDEPILDPLSSFLQEKTTTNYEEEEEELINKESSPVVDLLETSLPSSSISSPIPSNYLGSASLSPQQQSQVPNDLLINLSEVSIQDQAEYVDVRHPTASTSSSPSPTSSIASTPSTFSSSRQQPQGYSPFGINSMKSLNLLTGEVIKFGSNCTYINPLLQELPCLLQLTNFRIFIQFIDTTIPSINIHTAAVDKFEREKRSKDIGTFNICFNLIMKDFRQYKLVLNGKNFVEVETSFNQIQLSCCPTSVYSLFVFKHSLPRTKPIFDLKLEFERMGIFSIKNPNTGNNRWEIHPSNSNFLICKTYTTTLVFPKGITQEDLIAIANFRSGHRLPTLTWGSHYPSGTLWRSSQPKAGVSGSCHQDERLLEAIARSNVSKTEPSTLFIVDCRSKTSAMANRAAGAGYESSANYPSSRLEFFNIPNIHGVRDSYKSLLQVVTSPFSGSLNEASFNKQVEDTQWLNNIRLILRASFETAQALAQGIPTLVHCSHGWDRTAQVCALAQLLLDPHYRTIEGFGHLFEKEWKAYGHPFAMRCAQGLSRGIRSDDEVSQIFIQYLDCVYQLLKTYPHLFEFNSRFLCVIAENVYSGRFENFLFSSELDRRMAKVSQDIPDIWSFLDYNLPIFKNDLYLPHDNIKLGVDSTTGIPFGEYYLPPYQVVARNVSLWHDFFCRNNVQGISLKIIRNVTSTALPPSPYLRYLSEYELSCQEPTLYEISQKHRRRLLEDSGSTISASADYELPPLLFSTFDYGEAMRRREKVNSNELKLKTCNKIDEVLTYLCNPNITQGDFFNVVNLLKDFRRDISYDFVPPLQVNSNTLPTNNNEESSSASTSTNLLDL